MKAVQNKRAIIVGIFISLGILIIIVAVFTLGAQKKTFVKKFAINAVFNDVSGLQAGNNVWFSGVKIGTVKKVGFSSNAQVLVTMNIEKNTQNLIHKDAKAKISSDGLIGNKIVVIYGGSSTSPEVVADDYLTVEKALSTEDMLATLQANNKNLLDITNNFKLVSKRITDGGGTIGTLLNDTILAGKLRSTVNNLQSTVANFKAASLKSEQIIANVETFSHKLNQEGTLANDLVSDTVIVNSLRGTVTQLREVSYTAKTFIDNINKASSGLNTNDNTIGMLLNDEKTAASLKNTIRNLETGSKKLDQDLEALQHNFLLKGFFKKKAKTDSTYSY